MAPTQSPRNGSCKPVCRALPATTITLVIAGLALSPLMVLHAEHLTDTNSLMLIAWIAIIATVTAYAAFVYGLHRTTALTAGTLSLAEPLVAAALGVIVLHEALTPSAIFGSLALLAGLVTVTLFEILRRSIADASVVGSAQRRHSQPGWAKLKTTAESRG